MNYPPYNLTKRSRWYIFAFFVSVFLVLAPTLTLYTTGYRFDSKSLTLSRTGGLSIDIEPRDAKIYLNDSLVSSEVPVRLSHLSPGTYKIRIEKENYMPWIKEIVVEKNKTSYIKNIFLFEKNKPVKIEKNESLSAIYPSFESRYILEMFQSQNETILTLFDTRNESTSRLFKKNQASSFTVVWSEKSDSLALLEESASGTDVHLLEANNPASISTFPIQKKATNFQWIENFYKESFLLRDQSSNFLFELPASVKASSSTIPTAFSFREGGNNDWYFDASSKSLRLENTDKSIYVGVDAIQKILDINGNRALIQTDQELLVIDRNTEEIKTIHTPNFYFDRTRGEVIAWSSWELWTIYQNGQVALLNRMSEAIKQIAALDENGQLLMVTQDKILAFNPGYYVTQELLNNVSIEKVSVDQKRRTLYFLGTFEGERGLYRLKY